MKTELSCTKRLTPKDGVKLIDASMIPLVPGGTTYIYTGTYLVQTFASDIVVCPYLVDIFRQIAQRYGLLTLQ